MKRRLLQVAISVVLCGVLVSLADWRSVGARLLELDATLLAAGLALFVPQTVLSAWRWQRMTADVMRLSLGESLRLTLASSALNLVVPSKLGDFSKAALASTAATGDRRRLAVLVAVEKGADLTVLLLAMLVGMQAGWFAAVVGGLIVVVGWHALSLRRACTGTTDHAPAAPWRATLVPASPIGFLAATAVLWTLHLTQIHCFLLAAGVPTSWSMTAARVPAALLAGVVPAAFCGIGTRDAALVQLYADAAPAATMLVVGLLTSLRYVVPGAIGIPFLASLRRSPTAEPRPVARSTNHLPRPRPVATSATV